MSEYQIETRRRSRSKTPFLRSLCDHENCEHAADGEPHHHPPQRKRAKTPNVRTIIEEEVTSSSSPHTSVSAQKTGEIQHKKVEEQRKAITSDYSSEGISPENKARKSLRSEFSEVVTTTAAVATSASTVIKSTTFSSSSTTSLTRKLSKSAGGGVGIGSISSEGHMATSTPKANNFNVLQSFAAQYSDSAIADESRQNQLNSTQERVRKSLYNKSNENNTSNNSKGQQSSLRQSFNGSTIRSNISNQNIDPKEHLPYMEYKNAGEYWNVTPKTDYTYSELSPHRRELAPGVVAMPNMSRHSLGNYHARVHAMIERYPEKEDWIRRRYQTDTYAKEQYDFSGDEIDFLYTNRQVKNKTNWFQRFFNSIITFFITCWQSISNRFHKRSDEQIYQEEYYRKYYGKNTVASKG